VTPRLATHVWVGAYLARLRLEAVPAVLRARGDADAGAVIVSLATMDGRAKAFQRRFDLLTDTRVWEPLAEGTEAEVDAVLARARSRDPDLWIVEIEDPKGRTLLDDPALG
jgi:hypothetical protein